MGMWLAAVLRSMKGKWSGMRGCRPSLTGEQGVRVWVYIAAKTLIVSGLPSGCCKIVVEYADTRCDELVVSFKIPFVSHYILASSAYAMYGEQGQEYQGCLIPTRRGGIEENLPFWDEEHSQIGMNDSAMHLIINYIYAA
jgi:hypothetical protein